jgi:hypothetical protein
MILRPSLVVLLFAASVVNAQMTALTHVRVIDGTGHTPL